MRRTGSPAELTTTGFFLTPWQRCPTFITHFAILHLQANKSLSFSPNPNKEVLLYSTGKARWVPQLSFAKLLGLHCLASSLTSLTDLTGISKSNKFAPMLQESFDMGRKANFLLNPKMLLSCLCDEHTRREPCWRDPPPRHWGSSTLNMSNTLHVVNLYRPI